MQNNLRLIKGLDNMSLSSFLVKGKCKFLTYDFLLNTINFKYLQFNQAIKGICGHSSIANAVYMRLQMSQKKMSSHL